MVVHDGAVVVAWGDVERRYMLHSVRKSMMNGLIGVGVKEGRIDLDATMEQLGIDDVNPPLTEQEKSATVFDLLRARSGVYHAAAAEPPGNEKPRPGSHSAGENWCYNNWDFNALATVVEKRVGHDVFEYFDTRFAGPLQMQDFRQRDGHYQADATQSLHPAYVMRMSARDMARFGLLYLNDGAWGSKRILSEEWVRESTRVHSPNAWGEAYGMLWWIMETEPFREQRMYSGLGIGEQALDVVPGSNLVLVHRVDTYASKNVTREQRLELVKLTLEALTGDVARSAKLVPLASVPRDLEEYAMPLSRKNELVGSIAVPAFGFTATIVLDGTSLVLDGPIGKFELVPMAADVFVLEDAGFKFRLEEDADSKGRQLVPMR